MSNQPQPEFGNLRNVKVLSAGSVIAGPFACALFAGDRVANSEIASLLATLCSRLRLAKTQ